VTIEARWQLAQVNIGRLKQPLDHPATRDFVDNLDRINALADRQPGFVWRPVGEGDGSFDVIELDEPLLVLNLSVWTDPGSLAAFVYRTAHREVMRRRREWFETMDVFLALWWVRAGHRPAPAEAVERLSHLERHGPSAQVFTFRELFAAPDGEEFDSILDECA
jgi:hypothetical protein